MTVGQRIREARKKAGLTQKELADKLGISYVGVSHWENGQRNPKLSTLARIADALSIPVIDLLGSVKHIEYPVTSETTGETEIIDMPEFELLDSVKDHEVPFSTEITGLTGSIDMSVLASLKNWYSLGDDFEEANNLLKMFYVSLEAKLVSEPSEMIVTIHGIRDMVDMFLELNYDGQMVSKERMEEMTEHPRYQKTPPQAAARDGDNTEKEGEGS